MRKRIHNKIDRKEREHVLLVGNGINKLFPEEIELSMEDFFDKKDQENLYFPMAISVAGREKRESNVQDRVIEKINMDNISEKKKDFLRKILELDIKNILTTNYSFEFEKTVIENISKGKIYENYVYGKDNGELSKSERDLGMYQGIRLDYKKKEKILWHIHGLGVRKNSIIFDQYSYGKLLTEVVNHSKGVLHRWNAKNNFYTTSWIDHFLIGEVHILGFSFDLAEIDLWWLLEYKRKHFSFTKVYYYLKGSEKENQKNEDIYRVLNSYEVEIVEYNESEEYMDFYNWAIKKIEKSSK